MGCGASKAGDAEMDGLAKGVLNGAGISAYVVSGAGTSKVNGTYVRDGVYQGGPCFKSTTAPVWLVMDTGTWYLTPSDKLDGEECENNFYETESEDYEALPPELPARWEANEGDEPMPSLQAVNEGPEYFEVQGAGLAAANGRYTREGMHEVAPLYTKGSLWLFRSPVNGYRWMIADKNSIDENEGDLYRSTERGDYPPAQPWTTREEGTAPAPTLAAFDAGGVLLRHGWAPASAFAPSPMPAGAAAMAVAVGGCEPFMTTTTTTTTTVIGGAGPAAAIPMATPVAMA